MSRLALNKISILNYKNILDKTFNFDNKINCFVGHNGVGKTNILDSIYHLAIGKSSFSISNEKRGSVHWDDWFRKQAECHSSFAWWRVQDFSQNGRSKHDRCGPLFDAGRVGAFPIGGGDGRPACLSRSMRESSERQALSF